MKKADRSPRNWAQSKDPLPCQFKIKSPVKTQAFEWTHAAQVSWLQQAILKKLLDESSLAKKAIQMDKAARIVSNWMKNRNLK